MAFIELTEDEITMLSEAEKLQYNRQLKLNRERVAFVEKVEQIENAEFQYQKPKIKRIKPVRRIEIPQYRKVKRVPLVMPLKLLNSKEFSNRAVHQRSINDRIRVKLRSMDKVANVPAVKKAVPASVISFNEKKSKISNVSKTKHRITAPTLKFKSIGEKKITGISKKKIAILPDISFEYIRKPVKVTEVKLGLPRIRKFVDNNVVKIKNIPSVFVKSVPKKKYTYRSGNEQPILDVKERVLDAKVELSQLSFEYIRKPITVTQVTVGLPKAKKFTSNNVIKTKNVPSVSVGSVVKRQYSYNSSNEQSILDVKAKVFDAKVKAPRLVFETPIIDMKAVPKIQQIGKIDSSKMGELRERISSGELIRIDPNNFMVSVEMKPVCEASVSRIKGVSVPILKKYHQPIMATTIVVKMQKLQLPKLEIHTPDYTEDYVKNVISGIMKGLQGA